MRSEICIFNIETNETEVLASADMLLEAPNWSPDGMFLIVNGEGAIFRIDFDEPNALQQIDTDYADRCNSCHGISPDGTMLAFSHGYETSIVYTVPIDGGAIKRITTDEPSYFHGWSPDSKLLAYSGRAKGPMQIFTISVDGGEPVQLTQGDGHKDGPAFSSDGQWVWFNSEHGGAMDLWRVRADGSSLQQVTDDAEANYWPHPSPDGMHVLYLSAAADADMQTRGNNITLKLMNADGGEAHTLTMLVGGQGSLDAPCWSPDAKRFAFIRYQQG